MADDEAGVEIDNSEPIAPGERLRLARETKGMSVADVAAATRIPRRHIEAIEEGDYGDLPGRTYAIGFSRSYAKVVDLDEDEIVDEVRERLGVEQPTERRRDRTIQTEDPTRVPSRGLVFASIAAALILLAGIFVFTRTFFAPGEEPDTLLAAEEEQAAAEQDALASAEREASQRPIADGPVVFTSTEEGMWVRFYDGDESDVLMESLMAEGESYTIPDSAQDPRIRTGRPDAFSITVGGRDVPRLAEDNYVISDVDITSEALLARDGVGLTGTAPTQSAGT